jgi:hypothetical protein
MGTIALIIFVLTYSAGLADLRTLVVGAALTVIGLVFRRRGAPAQEAESTRFRTVRKLMGRPPPTEKETTDEDVA